jgi:hypothetical protein
MHPIATAVLKAGILPEETLAEFRRWGHQIELPTAPPPRKPEEVVQAIEEALQEQGLVLTRETDLGAVNFYLQTSLPGVLHVVLGEGDDTLETDIPCTFGVTPMGEYIIRWHSESIEEVMTNGRTHLLLDAKSSDGLPYKVFFNRMREVFFGDTKAFIICTPTKE